MNVPLSASERQSGVVLCRRLTDARAGKTVLPYYSVLKMAAFGGSEWAFLSSRAQTYVIDIDGFFQCYGKNWLGWVSYPTLSAIPCKSVLPGLCTEVVRKPSELCFALTRTIIGSAPRDSAC